MKKIAKIYIFLQYIKILTIKLDLSLLILYLTMIKIVLNIIYLVF